MNIQPIGFTCETTPKAIYKKEEVYEFLRTFCSDEQDVEEKFKTQWINNKQIIIADIHLREERIHNDDNGKMIEALEKTIELLEKYE